MIETLFGNRISPPATCTQAAKTLISTAPEIDCATTRAFTIFSRHHPEQAAGQWRVRSAATPSASISATLDQARAAIRADANAMVDFGASLGASMGIGFGITPGSPRR